MNLEMPSGAVFSQCRTYRYALWRRWAAGDRLALFLGLNPSTADGVHNDPTIRRCIQFAQDWGYDGVLVGNLFAYRTPYPKRLFEQQHAEGPDNRQWLRKLLATAARAFAAWGNAGHQSGPSEWLINAHKEWYCLRINRSGAPAHPLYIPADITPMPYSQPASAPVSETGPGVRALQIGVR